MPRVHVPLRAVSLFSGVGGLEWGFVRQGVRIVRAWDHWEPARLTYRANLGSEPLARDVMDLTPADFVDAQIAFAGPPCQGFSALAGRDSKDPRNNLILHTARLLARSRVPAVFIENVSGIKWQSEGIFIRQTLHALREGGYTAEVVDFDFSLLGLPQRRRRVLIVGVLPPLGRELIDAVSALAQQRLAPRSVSDAILPEDCLRGLPNHQPRTHRADWYETVIASIGPGQKLCDTRLGPTAVHSWDLPQVFGSTTSNERKVLISIARLRRRERGRRYRHIGDGRAVTAHQLGKVTELSPGALKKALNRLVTVGYLTSSSSGYFDLARKFNGRFKRLKTQGPAPAVLKDFGFARNILHPVASRGLTVRECARLQGFPDTFEFLGSLTQQYQLVANAFPPSISALLAATTIPLMSGVRFSPNSYRAQVG
jgi:DNA (cytosine-5)-methyltransferase 1